MFDLHTKSETTTSIEVETAEAVTMRLLAAGREISSSNEDFFLRIRNFGISYCHGAMASSAMAHASTPFSQE